MFLIWENWPELRRDYDNLSSENNVYDHSKRENWPELRRDYDHNLYVHLLKKSEGYERTDLNWEGITT